MHVYLIHHAVLLFKFTCLDTDWFGFKASALHCTYVIKSTFIEFFIQTFITQGSQDRILIYDHESFVDMTYWYDTSQEWVQLFIGVSTLFQLRKYLHNHLVKKCTSPHGSLPFKQGWKWLRFIGGQLGRLMFFFYDFF